MLIELFEQQHEIHYCLFATRFKIARNHLGEKHLFTQRVKKKTPTRLLFCHKIYRKNTIQFSSVCVDIILDLCMNISFLMARYGCTL